MNKSASFAFLFAILVITAVPGYKGNSDHVQVSNATQGPITAGYSNTTERPTPTVNSSLPQRCNRKTVLLTQSSGRIRSPNYPEKYDINQQCTWRVQVPRGFRIKIRFRRHFDLEDSPGCTKDYIMLSDTKQFRSQSKRCGGARPQGIITPKNVLWVRFYSDHRTTGKGFYISYMSVDENECKREMCTFPTLCRNMVGSYACDCPDGYANRGPKQKARCVDIDECKVANGRCHHKCVNTEGSYYCQCRKGFKLAPDERRCRDKNECTKDNGGCSHFCVNTRSSYRCACPSGYALYSNEKTCYPEISFSNNQYTVKVSENTQPNTVVTKLQARTFPDKHIVTYALISENLKRPSIFKINSGNGKIILNKRPDIHETRSFLLEVQASYQARNSSKGVKYRSARSFVLINILKARSKRSLSTSHTSFYIRVPCDTPFNRTVYRVRTTDSESAGKTRISFRRKLDHFSITSGGKIKTRKSLLLFCYATPFKTFRASVMVRDTAGIKRTADVVLRIVITPPGLLSRDNTGTRRYN